MFSLIRLAAFIALAAATGFAAQLSGLRVCADANNLPFSNSRGQGLENELAQRVANVLHRDLQYVWLSQQTPYANKRIESRSCDLLMATTGGSEVMIPSIPYYRSAYVFVTRQDRHIRITSLEDEKLATYRIGALTIGRDEIVTPGADALAQRGLARNIIGYNMFGNPLGSNAFAQLVDAVARGDVDVAIVWGPAAGYFALTSHVPLEITRIASAGSATPPRVAFDISMAVRRDNPALLQQVNEFITQRRKEISELLGHYGVPLLNDSSAEMTDYRVR